MKNGIKIDKIKRSQGAKYFKEDNIYLEINVLGKFSPSCGGLYFPA